MAEVTRLKGAILAKTEDRYFLVGNTKEPINYPEVGFHTPEDWQAPETPFVPLEPNGSAIVKEGGVMNMALEGQDLPEKLVKIFMIRRNGSISERLWSLILESQEDPTDDAAIPADWLAQTPEDIWDIVRDSVLRC